MSEASQQQFQVESNGRSNEQEPGKLDPQISRIETSFKVIASQYKQPHHRLLALHRIATFHGIPASLFKKCFELWLQSRSEGGEG